jgi:hypothetical protein
MGLRKYGRRLNSAGSGYGPATGPCEHSNTPSGYRDQYAIVSFLEVLCCRFYRTQMGCSYIWNETPGRQISHLLPAKFVWRIKITKKSQSRMYAMGPWGRRENTRVGSTRIRRYTLKRGKYLTWRRKKRCLWQLNDVPLCNKYQLNLIQVDIKCQQYN